MSSQLIDRRRFLARSAAAVTLAASPSLIGIRAGRAQDVASVRMQLGWLASNGILGEVAAIDRGFYAEEGIELAVVPGGPNVDGIAGVGSGQSTLGQISSSPSVMLARSAGVPVKAFLSGYQRHPFTYFSTAENPIRTPADMVGKTIATQPTAFILLRALLAQNGIAEGEVEMVNMGSDMNQLLTGQADAVTGWSTNVNALSILGDDRVEMTLWDNGLQLYANVYYTTDRELGENADVLQRFTRATARGWAFARENPEDAVEMLVAAYPNLDRASELQAVGPVLAFSFGGSTASDGWGTMARENWERQISAYADLDQFTGDVPSVDDVADFSVLDATIDARRQTA